MKRRLRPSRAHGLEIVQEVAGAHHGQIDTRLIAYSSDGRSVGFLDYSIYGHRTLIRMVASHARGVGTALVRYLAHEVGYDAIDWGLVTDDGAYLKKKMDREFGVKPPKPIVAADFARRYGGKLIEESSDGETLRMYVEFDSDHMADEFLVLARRVGDLISDQRFDGKAWIEVDVPAWFRPGDAMDRAMRLRRLR